MLFSIPTFAGICIVLWILVWTGRSRRVSVQSDSVPRDWAILWGRCPFWFLEFVFMECSRQHPGFCTIWHVFTEAFSTLQKCPFCNLTQSGIKPDCGSDTACVKSGKL